ncbi:MAG: hypothetical protein ABSA90_06965 [Xanthobacteraceae bacterium]
MSVHDKIKSTIGPNERGEHPGHPNRPVENLRVHHTHDRKFETDASMGKGLARESHAHKGARPVGVHNGMSHRDGGTLNTGISRTASAAALAGYRDPTAPPAVAKRLPIPACNPSTPSRPDRGYGSIFNPDSGPKVMRQAVLSGSTKLPDEVCED